MNCAKPARNFAICWNFFREFYPVDDISRPLKQLRKLQNYLANFRMCMPASIYCTTSAMKCGERRRFLPKPFSLWAFFLRHLTASKKTLRKEFPDHFEPFDHSDNRARFRRLFKPVTPDEHE